jgi:hypothetical protein
MTSGGIKPHARGPERHQRSEALQNPDVVDVGPGTKWNSPIRRQDVQALVSSEPDIAAAVKHGGWKARMLLLYRDYLLEAGLDPSELRGKDLSCTCKRGDPCHADVLIELANC